MALPVRSVISGSIFLGDCCHARLYSFAAPSVPYRRTQYKASTTKMASANAQGRPKTIDSHLHIWASPQEVKSPLPCTNVSCKTKFRGWDWTNSNTNHAFSFSFLCLGVQAADKYPYFPGQEPTLPGHLDFLLQVRCSLRERWRETMLLLVYSLINYS